MIPLVAHPFDLLMEKVLDWTVRLMVKKHELVKQPGPIILQPGLDGKVKVTQLPSHWNSIPRRDYWLTKNEKTSPAVHAAPYRTSTHRHKNAQQQNPFTSIS